jgi:hypothetical protein
MLTKIKNRLSKKRKLIENRANINSIVGRTLKEFLENNYGDKDAVLLKKIKPQTINNKIFIICGSKTIATDLNLNKAKLQDLLEKEKIKSEVIIK